MRFGLYAELGGNTYAASQLPSGGYKLISDNPAPGFKASRWGGYVCEVSAVDRLYTVNCRVRYGGKWFTAQPVKKGVLLSTGDADIARSLGFELAERGEWRRIISEDDVQEIIDIIKNISVG